MYPPRINGEDKRDIPARLRTLMIVPSEDGTILTIFNTMLHIYLKYHKISILTELYQMNKILSKIYC